MSLRLVPGNITLVQTDAVVNAANSQLAPGGGVSGAIHAAGGPSIAREAAAYVAEHGPVAPGSAAITTGGTLPARYVIHAVGPIWRGGMAGETETLASSYRSAIEVADEHGDIRTIAFPSISTGIFGFPLDLAAPIAVGAAGEALATATNVQEVRFVAFDDATLTAFRRAMESCGR